MKIRLDWSDGHYSVQEYSQEAERLKLPYVEMNDTEWLEYGFHVSQCRKWHERLRELDNEQYEKEQAS